MRNHRGFTVVEMLVVVTVATILVMIGMNSMSAFQGRTAVRQAQNAFLSLHARARAQAVEFGQNTELNVDTGGDSVWISRNDTTLTTVRFRGDLGVDIDGSGVYTLCMTSRGYADASCNSFGEGTLTVRFIQASDTLTVSVLPLGQALY
jgi:prepilin-type N-terminal cleavage/methylation domain-containing protein